MALSAAGAGRRTAHRFGDFGVSIGFDTDQAVVRIRGDVDVITASTLAGVLRGVTEEGHGDVVLDLADLTFMGAAGLGVIATTAAHLGTSGAVLTVRSPPVMTRRILDITGVDALVQIEAFGVEERLDVPSGTLETAPANVSSAIATAAVLPAMTDMIDAALRVVTALASATVEGADGVSVSLERGRRVSTVASSNDTVMRMDHHQYEVGEGPCLSAMTEGRRFQVDSLADEDRWPAFVRLAIEDGIGSILSTPLLTADGPVGALNIYSHVERAFGPAQQKLAAVFADEASGIVAADATQRTVEPMSKRISDALVAREVIAQAQGVLMARQGVTADEAAAALRQSARWAEVPVLRYAADVVASTGAGTRSGELSAQP